MIKKDCSTCKNISHDRGDFPCSKCYRFTGLGDYWEKDIGKTEE